MQPIGVRGSGTGGAAVGNKPAPVRQAAGGNRERGAKKLEQLLPAGSLSGIMRGSRAGNVGERAADALPAGEPAQPAQVTEAYDLGGATQGERLERLGAEQEKRDQLVVTDGLHARIALGGRVDRGIVPGAPGHGQAHDRSQIC